MVADVGSGAGLPGLPLAIVRPDLRVVLVEPLLRRATFLGEAVAALGLRRPGRGAPRPGRGAALEVDVVTARAVAPLDRLAGWTLPLVRVGGVLLAVKGEGAAAEVAASRAALERLGGGQTEVLDLRGRCGGPAHDRGAGGPAHRRSTEGGAMSTGEHRSRRPAGTSAGLGWPDPAPTASPGLGVAARSGPRQPRPAPAGGDP